MEISKLSDAQLRDELKQYGINLGPIVGTTRKVYEKKLQSARDGKVAPPAKAVPAKTPKSPPKKATASPSPSRSSSTSRSTTRGRKSIVRSESEERSDTEMEPAPSRSKPVVSTPKKKAAPAPAKPNATLPIPGLNTTLSRSSLSDKPGYTPPRTKVNAARENLNVSSYSASRSNRMMEPATSGEESGTDDHEESSRFVSTPISSSIFSFGSAKQSTVKSPSYVKSPSATSSESSFTRFFQRKPTLDFDDAPLSSYDMQVGGRHTRVAKDKKTGQYKETAYDVSRILLIILCIFLALLFLAYIFTAKREVIVSSFKTVAGAAQDTVLFVYNYAIFPLLVVAVLSVMVATAYWIFTRRKIAAAEEEEAFYDLIETIIQKVREAHESGDESISIPHVRDQIFPPSKRRGVELARWERAVQFVNEKESRILTESVYRRGVEVPSWKWMGSEKKQGWKGSAFTSVPIPEPVSCCLKVRNMYLAETGYDDEAAEVVEQVYAKLKPLMPMRVEAINENRDPCVYIRMKTKSEAGQVYGMLQSQWFNGQLIHVKYIRDQRFDERFPSSSNTIHH